ncbi:patatin-like phospholipase family protein [Aquimarina sp. ERC-38]|uniref:patatin-like phospholipase family protein n=1 Tax=Aquimarina sp. ERC-38 TaxID=2949996 RepID=UPI0022479E8B|nr:patatin-like phospholipase family protein [Aquimarina sp. ERC-38]UZO82133.1 patatin-like phospholipase family protein [Aquimarina sp. ERC-38]
MSLQKRHLFVFLVTTVFFSIFSVAQKSTNVHKAKNTDVKVGLVLSGGGAKGFAHIGALKAIEEAGVRIDFIGGTSMGAIIGALYASGYTASQLDSIFTRVDFNRLIQDELPRSVKTLYEKEDAEKYALTLPFNGFKVGLPQGLSKGQNFFNEFSKYTSHVKNINDFNKLPIPFFCMATNITNGQAVLLDKGYLPEAVAASAALPSIFNPVVVDGQLLTDGGVTNNFPVVETIAKGAEVIIGVDVQDSLLNTKQLTSVTDIMLQISNFKTIKAMRNKRPLTDVYINPSIEEFSLLSFDKTKKIIECGEKAAKEVFANLQEIAAKQKVNRKETVIPPFKDSIRINSIRIEGNDTYTRAYIKGKLKLRDPKVITYDQLYEGVNNLSATGNFDRVSHRIIQNAWGNELVINVKETVNTMFLRFALHYDDLYQTAGLANYTKKRVFFNNDVISADVILGDNIRYDLAYYIDKGYYWSIGLRHTFDRFERNLSFENLKNSFEELPDVDVNSINMDFLNLESQFYIETLWRQDFSFGIGAKHRYFRLQSETIGRDENQLPRRIFNNDNYGALFSYVTFDNVDNKYFPSSGISYHGNLDYFVITSEEELITEPFAMLTNNFEYTISPFDNFAFTTAFRMGARFGNSDNTSFNYFLGGFGAKNSWNTSPFYGYDFLELNGDSFATLAVSFDYNFFRKNHVNISANYANVGRQLFRNGNWLTSPDFSGYALGYGLETFAGPIQIKYSYSPEVKQSEWFFSLGFWF